MAKINLVTLNTVNAMLGLVTGADLARDAALTGLIPRVSALIRRILNTDFNTFLYSSYTISNDKIFFFADTSNKENIITTTQILPLGTVLEGDGLPDDTYLIDFNSLTGYYTLSNLPTASGNFVTATINISQWEPIAKIIYYKYLKIGTAKIADKKLSSFSVSGVLSQTFAKAEIDNQYDIPVYLIAELGEALLSVC